MLHGVTYMGLVAPGESVTVAGLAGPANIEAEPAAPLAVYRIEGWDPNGDSPEAIQDEAQGNRVVSIMEAVGNAIADDRVDAQDVVSLSVSLQLPGGSVMQALIPVTEEILEALQDDGRIDPQEAIAIASSIVQAVISLRS